MSGLAGWTDKIKNENIHSNLRSIYDREKFNVIGTIPEAGAG